jgi:hypothetical protein
MALKTSLFAIVLLVPAFASAEQSAKQNTEQSFPPANRAVLPPAMALQARQSRTISTVDFSSMSDCAKTFCPPSDFQGPGLCPSVACPSSNNNSCTTVNTDCFCNLKNPFGCAWICDWSAWYNFEDWYSATCPDTEPVDFSGLPKCIRACLPSQFIIYGCITLSRSCVCNTHQLFNCASNCNAQSNRTINSWFSGLCGTTLNVTVDTAPAAIHSGVVPTVQARTPIPWYETFGIVVAAVSLPIWVIAVVVGMSVHARGKLSATQRSKLLGL